MGKFSKYSYINKRGIIVPDKILPELKETEEEQLMEQNIDLMKNRRKMAYYCLYTTIGVFIVIALALLFKPSVLDSYNKVEGTLSTLILGWFSIIALYFGASSLSEIFGNKVK